MAPNLKGRPRKKKPCPQRRDSLNGIKDSNNNSESKAVAKVKCEAKSALPKPKSNNSNCKKGSSEDKSKIAIVSIGANYGQVLIITARRQWKHIYDELGGNPGSTSAATCTRRHYERPYK
ncbi:hypothetical protein DV515_00006158 [Chloebia gouldiae]|uniref:Uncharacterized protein n=1 Tax=Chloebia gouldiae TaxID=44316 RepID=A0A3L8SL21_CHLGU|nr:hypothetical protein DV515_00006158 [Chloebia gouldiae]